MVWLGRSRASAFVAVGRVRIGSGKTQTPALLLRIPVSIIVGAVCFGGGIFSGILARDFSESGIIWRKRLLTALCYLLPGGLVLSFTLF